MALVPTPSHPVEGQNGQIGASNGTATGLVPEVVPQNTSAIKRSSRDWRTGAMAHLCYLSFNAKNKKIKNKYLEITHYENKIREEAPCASRAKRGENDENIS